MVEITEEMKEYFLRVMREMRGEGGVKYEINEDYITIVDSDIEKFPELAPFDEDGPTPAYLNVKMWTIEPMYLRPNCKAQGFENPS